VAQIGFHASHEQFPPSELLACAQAAERAGFSFGMCSDHFYPWSDTQGHSGFALSWLGAALQATSMPFGVVTTPGYRYHPAILAQACASLAEMFPERFWVALGSGEALNEHVTGECWPTKAERNARLRECADIMRALWAGETVSHTGQVRIEEARLYTRPKTPPLIIGAAITPQTAEWLGGWADGLITINQHTDRLQQVVEAFRAGGGAGKPMYLQVHLSYAEHEEEARQSAFDQWRVTVLPSPVLAELRMPAQFDAAASFVRRDDLDDHVRISADLDQHIAWLNGDIELGFSAIALHNVGRNQRQFIDAFGERVLPTAIESGRKETHVPQPHLAKSVGNQETG
jgi:coenzyme F420-dependent glucose-6-phosphate dehydrogenase